MKMTKAEILKLIPEFNGNPFNTELSYRCLLDVYIIHPEQLKKTHFYAKRAEHYSVRILTMFFLKTLFFF